jgi:tetratricopeptide (TPR) repeat protein
MISDQNVQRESYQRALMLLRSGDAELAEQICRGALKKFPADANILCLSARALMRLDQPELAEQRANAALAIYPDYPRPYEILGDLFMGQDKTEDAVANFQRAVGLDPARAMTHMKLGLALIKLGRTKEAQGAIENFKRLDPHREMIARAAALERDGDLAESEKIYRQILKQDPDNVEALRLLAIVAAGQRQFGDAEILLQHAVDCAPTFLRARADLVSVQLERDKFDEAIKNAKRLVQLDKELPDSYLLLGNAYGSAGRYEEAVQAYEKTLELAPAHRGAFSGLGNMLKTIGRYEGAVGAYRAGIQSHPDFAEAYWSLANLKTFRFEEHEVAAMEALLDKEDLTAESYIQLCNALGLEYENRQDYERAFAYFARGNQARRESERYDAAETEFQHDRLIELFDNAFLERHAGSGDPDGAPIFIVGLPRSGSTLIEQILASHSQVEGTHELSDLGRITEQIPKMFEIHQRYPDSLLKLDRKAFAELGALYISRTRRHRAGRAHFIDKNPNNFVHTGLLKLILPNAKIIDARRHPLDSCFGSYKQLFARGQPFTYDMYELGEYYLQYSRLMKHWQQAMPGFVLEVHYEDVVADLEQQIRRILDHCELPWEDACLRFHETDRAVKTASSEQVRQPIYDSSVNLWRNYEPQLGELIEILEPELRLLPEADQPISLRG